MIHPFGLLADQFPWVVPCGGGLFLAFLRKSLRLTCNVWFICFTVGGGKCPMELLLLPLLAELVDAVLVALEEPEAMEGVLDRDLSPLLVNMLLV